MIGGSGFYKLEELESAKESKASDGSIMLLLPIQLLADG